MRFPGGGGASGVSHRRPEGAARAPQVEHKGYRSSADQRARSLDFPDVDFKTLITLTTVSPQNIRRPDPVNMALEERTVADLMLQGTMDRGIAEYYEETTVTNAATTVSEGGTKPESALAWTLRTDTARKIAHLDSGHQGVAWTTCPGWRARSGAAGLHGAAQVEETQILTGDGNAPNLLGLLNRSGIQTQAKGADPTMDAVYKAMQKIRGAGGSASRSRPPLVMHPNDWTDIKLLRTADGIYIWGAPPMRVRIASGACRSARPRRSPRAPAWSARSARTPRSCGARASPSPPPSTDLLHREQGRMLAEERLGLAVYRASAFCTVTALP
jgi:hypothetical protein